MNNTKLVNTTPKTPEEVSLNTECEITICTYLVQGNDLARLKSLGSIVCADNGVVNSFDTGIDELINENNARVTRETQAITQVIENHYGGKVIQTETQLELESIIAQTEITAVFNSLHNAMLYLSRISTYDQDLTVSLTADVENYDTKLIVEELIQ